MNFYALLSLVGLFLTLFLAFFTLRGPRKRINVIFLLVLACAFLWMLGEFMRRIYFNLPSPDFWSQVETIGVIFVAPLFFRFVTLIHATTNPSLLNDNRFWLVLFGIGGVFIVLLVTDNLIGETALYYLGYDYELKPAYLFLYLFVAVVLVISVIHLFRVFRRMQIGFYRKYLRNTLLGCIFALSILFLGDFLIVALGLEIPTLSAVELIAVEISIGSAVVRRGFMPLPSVSRFLLPLPEASLSSRYRYRLARGRCYLIISYRPHERVEIFLDQITHGVPGFWITSREPKQMEKYGLLRTPIIFISSHRIPGEIVMPPKELNRLKEFVENRLNFVRGRSVVLLDCFYELMVENGFRHMLDFVHELGKICFSHSSNLIVPLNPRRFTVRQLKLIEEALGATKLIGVEKTGVL
ncbi:MAG: DUF835 domain-containing protein [Candidatus Hadarchaeum sp.]|uniref:DUF835 domain-containing protein n=1 Tax=Candidatus Hadarchaeum sp. TaxID=2883567 RepID=UPI00316CF052